MDDLLLRGVDHSQSSLATYEQCSRRFYLRYVRRLNWPAPLTSAAEKWEATMRRGQLFHHLVQQDALGMEVSGMVQHGGDALLQEWWRNFTRHPPANLPAGPIFSEIQLSVPLGGHRLVARFDRVVCGEDGRICILDWKTGGRRPDQEAYARSWQTLVYCYVLVEGGSVLNQGQAISPEQVWLVYWHASYPDLLQPLDYSLSKHQEARGRLQAAIGEIASRRQEGDFPLTRDWAQCRRCEYRSYCERGREAAAEWEIDEEDGEGDLIPEAEL